MDEPNKVIVSVPDRHAFLASKWIVSEDGYLSLLSPDDDGADITIAVFSPGHWQSVHLASSQVPG